MGAGGNPNQNEATDRAGVRFSSKQPSASALETYVVVKVCDYSAVGTFTLAELEAARLDLLELWREQMDEMMYAVEKED
jgi:hypothetical protein